jgi:hypothetical protein
VEVARQRASARRREVPRRDYRKTGKKPKSIIESSKSTYTYLTFSSLEERRMVAKKIALRLTGERAKL